ncbi:MAG: fibro-slime domain-containing protein [Fibrobacterota bacterium]|nr:fibro-slime domain-containing protein [Fibrobacterota bacterium]QQS07638.1 MAG: fibro-slime domain-containing protein [Fibrobacterota bacterium]
MRPSGQSICGMSQPYVEETLLDKVSCGEAANSPDKWFAPVSRGTKAMNTSIPFAIDLAQSTLTTYGFADTTFFPLDTLAKLPGTNEKNPFLDAIKDNRLALHNFGFCVELHGQAQPTPGAILTVKADDDTWVFVDSQLVVDLGGQHSAEQRSFALDRLPLPLPPVMSIDLFHCERHVNESILSISANFPIHPVGTLKAPSRISSLRPTPALQTSLSMHPGRNALSIQAAPGRAWSLELRGLDGRLHQSITGTGPTMIPWTNSGISVALLRSGSETVRGRFVSAR